ncbi:MAG: hypothetical protein R3245_04960, partial [Kiloniellales bacterium]|nr:hypothetical protein [Kiloniellales bacterium]
YGLWELAEAKLAELPEKNEDPEKWHELYAEAAGLIYVSRLFGNEIGMAKYEAFSEKYGEDFSRLAEDAGERWLKRNVESPSGGLYHLYRYCETHDFPFFFAKRMRKDCRDHVTIDHRNCDFRVFTEGRDFLDSKLYHLCRFTRLRSRS